MKTFKKSLTFFFALCATCTDWTALETGRGFVFMENYNIEGKPNGFELLEPEIWFDIPGYEGLYQAGTWGNIKALEKRRSMGKHTHIIKIYPELIMKPSLTKRGYYIVQFLNNTGKNRWFTIHRIIGAIFHPNPENKATINHDDGIKIHNWPSNLQWNTQSENIKHAYRTGLIKTMPTGNQGIITYGANNPASKKVFNPITGETYDSINEAAIKNNTSVRSLYHQFSGDQKYKTHLKLI